MLFEAKHSLYLDDTHMLFYSDKRAVLARCIASIWKDAIVADLYYEDAKDYNLIGSGHEAIEYIVKHFSGIYIEEIKEDSNVISYAVGE